MSRLAEGFNRHYGLDVEVQFTPGPPSTEVAAKTILEYQAGRAASVDVLLAPADQTVSVVRAGALEPLDWSWAPNVRNPKSLGGDGVGVETPTRLTAWTPSTPTARRRPCS
jgi:hypothetical protein